mmetsp:Transcript_8399/g.29457  ORF Transcript_8399/g.29457 Transcript_8399/m.29457 type:complete len:625 (+) Transcript_8399:335-2209(+)
MATAPGPLYAFPWESWGECGKYALLLPFAAAVVLGRDDGDNWAWHMCVIAVARYVHAQLWISISRLHRLTSKTRIQARSVGFKQVDREDHWDDYIILQALIMTLVHWCPGLGFKGFPVWGSWVGMAQLLLLHAGPTEFIYYWLHRALHHHSLYSRYHSHHHASFVTEPITGSVHPFMEHLMYTANFAVPLLGTWACGGGSVAMFYAYLLGFDFMNAVGHCNWEFVPRQIFRALPFLKYMVYTPSFHSLHHSKVHVNFCLFMPIYDYAYGTLDESSWDLHERASLGVAVPDVAPDTVFLAHGTELLSMFHLPFALRSFSSVPFVPRWFLWPMYPVAALTVVLLRLFGTVFTQDKFSIGHLKGETWVTPAFAFQFFLKREHSFINRQIAGAIRQADARGVRVFGLGALNKAEFVNGGGVLFTKHLPDLRIRVVHGNTLTAAAILQKLPEGVREVFLTGSTSKLGRAIALYLAERDVRVRMYTTSEERYRAIADEVEPKRRHLLSRHDRLADGKDVEHWVVGKWLTAKEEQVAAPGTTFHQFVVPPLEGTRKDCVFTQLPAFRLPQKKTRGVKACEMTMPRGCVHACHAGALVHGLEGWDHNEVGRIDHTKIDTCWEAAMRHGFELV